MRNVSGSNAEETRMIKAVQGTIGAVQDGSIGTQTMSDIARVLNADCFPLALTVYNHPLIIAKDAVPAAVSKPLSCYANAISGSFSYFGSPCSILVNGNGVVRNESCHYWANGTPESVLYRLKDGSFGIKRVTTANDLPPNVAWAIGGVGLLGNFDPKAEGFIGAYSDVMRKTAHTLVGCKGGYVYLCYVSNMTGQQVNEHAKKLGLDYAIMLDGGHVAAINSALIKINAQQTQFYIVQAR